MDWLNSAIAIVCSNRPVIGTWHVFGMGIEQRAKDFLTLWVLTGRVLAEKFRQMYDNF